MGFGGVSGAAAGAENHGKEQRDASQADKIHDGIGVCLDDVGNRRRRTESDALHGAHAVRHDSSDPIRHYRANALGHHCADAARNRDANATRDSDTDAEDNAEHPDDDAGPADRESAMCSGGSRHGHIDAAQKPRDWNWNDDAWHDDAWLDNSGDLDTGIDGDRDGVTSAVPAWSQHSPAGRSRQPVVEQIRHGSITIDS